MRLSVVVLLCLLVSVTVAAPAAPLFKRGTVTIVQADRRVVLDVEVADTPQARAQGLMHRTSLADNAGMLFIFEEAQRLSFWMKNTFIPLSIAFIDPHWRINDIQDMDPPQPGGDIPIYVSRHPAKYALEVNQCFFRRHGFTVGARVVYRPAAAVRGRDAGGRGSALIKGCTAGP
ncbi:MAG: DUF192 domain-containing protein [Armatimonadota bacterium]|nr:DUF192 domain-containing protein [Armatimonadota bacterium]MDR5696319.1 DUF192 domain-containing protein [Armatimonadota bacterium]